MGCRGQVGILSFNGNKTLTTGGGGAILTSDHNLAKHAKHITTTAKLPHAFQFMHDQVGYNYRMPNINAALGCAQLEKINEFLAAKRKLAHVYESAFKNIQGVRFIKEPHYAKSNYWLNAFVLDKQFEHLKEPIVEELMRNKIMVRPLWNLQHTLPMHQHCPRMPLTIAESLYQRLIKIPSSALLGMKNTCAVS